MARPGAWEPWRLKIENETKANHDDTWADVFDGNEWIKQPSTVKLMDLITRVGVPQQHRRKLWLSWSGAEKAKKRADKHFFWKLVQQLRLFCAELPPDDTAERTILEDSMMDTSAISFVGLDARHLPKGEALLRPAPSWKPVGRDATIISCINSDVRRTFTANSHFPIPFYCDKEGRRRLRFVLLAFAHENSKIGYLQGMSFVAASLMVAIRGSISAHTEVEITDRADIESRTVATQTPEKGDAGGDRTSNRQNIVNSATSPGGLIAWPQKEKENERTSSNESILETDTSALDSIIPLDTTTHMNATLNSSFWDTFLFGAGSDDSVSTKPADKDKDVALEMATSGAGCSRLLQSRLSGAHSLQSQQKPLGLAKCLEGSVGGYTMRGGVRNMGGASMMQKQRQQQQQQQQQQQPGVLLQGRGLAGGQEAEKQQQQRLEEEQEGLQYSRTLNSIQEDTYWLMTVICAGPLHHYYHLEQEGLMRDAKVLVQLMKKLLPKLCAVFTKHHLELKMLLQCVVPAWCIPLLSQHMPHSVVCRLLDLMCLFSGSNAAEVQPTTILLWVLLGLFKAIEAEVAPSKQQQLKMKQQQLKMKQQALQNGEGKGKAAGATAGGNSSQLSGHNGHGVGVRWSHSTVSHLLRDYARALPDEPHGATMLLAAAESVIGLKALQKEIDKTITNDPVNLQLNLHPSPEKGALSCGGSGGSTGGVGLPEMKCRRCGQMIPLTEDAIEQHGKLCLVAVKVNLESAQQSQAVSENCLETSASTPQIDRSRSRPSIDQMDMFTPIDSGKRSKEIDWTLT